MDDINMRNNAPWVTILNLLKGVINKYKLGMEKKKIFKIKKIPKIIFNNNKMN
jgi:hypothetical protein